jgi:hypothetical protein
MLLSTIASRRHRCYTASLIRTLFDSQLTPAIHPHDIHPNLPTMSLLVDGVSAPSVTFRPSTRTVLSAAFSRLAPGVRGHGFLLTTSVYGYSAVATVIKCDIVASPDYDVVLGLDWAALLRDYLISLGHRLDSSFNAWLFFSAPSHPIGGYVHTDLGTCQYSSMSSFTPISGYATLQVQGTFISLLIDFH